MKKIILSCLIAALALGLLAGCSNSKASSALEEADAPTTVPAAEDTAPDGTGITYPVEIVSSLGVTVIEDEVNAVAVFDLAMLDILDTLGFGDRVVAVTHGNAFPEYLETYAGDEYIDLGGFKDWDEEALNESNPDLIFAGFRQAMKSLEEVQAVAPVLYFGNSGESGEEYGFLELVELRTKAVIALFGGEDEAQAYLDEISRMFDTIRAYTAEHEVTYIGVSTENNGISLGGQSGDLLDALGFVSLYENPETDIRGDSAGRASEEAAQSADSEAHGSGTDSLSSDEASGEMTTDNTEATAEAVAYILENDPAMLLVYDQDAAENEAGMMTAQEIIEASGLASSAICQEDRVLYLDPGLSSASGGLQSTVMQLEMIMELLDLA